VVAGRQLVKWRRALPPTRRAAGGYVLPRRLRLTAWGGLPVSARFGVRQGDAAAGGRVAWAPSWDSEVGASYAFVLDRGITARHDAAVDGRWLPTNAIRVQGHALFSLAEARLVEWSWPRTEHPHAGGGRLCAPGVAGPALPRTSSPCRRTGSRRGGAIAIWEPRPELAVTGRGRCGCRRGEGGRRTAGEHAPGTRLSASCAGAPQPRYLRAPGRLAGPEAGAHADADAFGETGR
jgi:hypothetical protein